LTRGQETALDEILQDMAGTKPMRRLLQGDVGCGGARQNALETCKGGIPLKKREF